MDKEPIYLLSTYKWPHAFPCENSKVSQCSGVEQVLIWTSLIHLKYTTHMRGADLVDHLRSNYLRQIRFHQWWNYLFYFLLYCLWTNMWIMHIKKMVDLKCPKKEHLVHYDFILKI